MILSPMMYSSHSSKIFLCKARYFLRWTRLNLRSDKRLLCFSHWGPYATKTPTSTKTALNFQLPVFNFLVCITHLFIFDFAWSCMNMKIWNFYFGAERRSKGFLLCCSRSQKSTRLSFLCPVSKEDDGKVTSWLHSHMTSLYSVIDHGTVCVAILDVGQSRQKLQQMYVIFFKFQRR